MSLKEMDLEKLTKFLLVLTDHVTCLSCCKSYIAPATASCGHTLCHTCWRGLRTCPTCAAPYDRKTLRLNLPLQASTKHVQSLGEAFEKLFSIKLDQLNPYSLGELGSEKDINKEVKVWLANSDNQFSAPLSQQSSQEHPPNPLEISFSNIQIHTITKKAASPPKVVHIPPPQDDWDKIEPMKEPEINTKNKENIIGPMDIEPFYLEDEYTAEHPRRSSRHRDLFDESCAKFSHLTTQKNSSIALDSEKAKELEKTKQTWQNVKKMRKEFSKLNKQNRSKLNVSIEKVKKAQVSKPFSTKSGETEKNYNIDDKTPGTTNKVDTYDAESNIKDTNNDVQNVQSTQIIPIAERQINEEPLNEEMVNRQTKNDESQQKIITMEVNQNNNEFPIVNAPSTTVQEEDDIAKEKKSNTTLFLRKSCSLPKNDCDDKMSKSDNHKPISADTDDIEITIKVGNTITNIIIKKKENDVQVKVSKDCEIQTSQDNFQNNDQSQVHSGVNNNIKIDVNSTPKNTIGSGNEMPTTNALPNIQSQSKSNLNKSNSVKKNTASAETATAQFEITESVEKELSNIMECNDEDSTDDVEHTSKSSVKNITQIRVENSDSQISGTQNKKNGKMNENYLEEQNINDLDIFGSGSIKEANVKLLTQPAPSEILISTVKSRAKTQKITSKRNRDATVDENIPTNKKVKMNDGGNVENLNIEQNSEQINYDAVMDQVFANIDADIKTQKSEKERQANCKKEQSLAASQTRNCNNKPNVQAIRKANEDNENIEQKHSENVFSAIDKDDILELTKTNIPQQIEEFLTPGLCRSLNAIQESQEEIIKTGKSRRKSIQDCDDSDMSVVEETPQKDISFSKLKRANTSKHDLDQFQESLADTKKIPSRNMSVNKSVINLTDSLIAESNKSNRDMTDANTTRKNQIPETPLTITNFVSQIKHKSTPAARKSLHFDTENLEDQDDPEQTLCPSSVVAKTTQEKEFLLNAFEKTPTAIARPLSTKKNHKNDKRLCLAGSCLSASEIIKLKYLCSERNWSYVDKYTSDITHLVVGVDEENKSQRSVKYMCALAASKWIVSFDWVKRCLVTKSLVDEEQFEALDSTGEAGPRRSRSAARKLFHGITFYCMPPFNVLDVDTLKGMLVAAGGRVARDIEEVRVGAGCTAPALLLAEPEHTQEDRFVYLTMESQVVPVNFEWVLNCLGSYTLGSVQDLLLCPSTLLPPATSTWPEVLLAHENYTC